MSPYHSGWSCQEWKLQSQAKPPKACRWCSEPCCISPNGLASDRCCGSNEGADLERFPPALSCLEKERRACRKRHPCGHWCGGVLGEERCLPCLNPVCRSREAPNRQTAVEWCAICFVETLGGAPAISLACGHVLHQHCVEAMIKKGQCKGRRLVFKCIHCPLCQAFMEHPALEPLVNPILSTYQKVRRKAVHRWVIEKREPVPMYHSPEEEELIASLALQKMAFFTCSQCKEPYYGGELECGVDDDDLDMEEDVQAALAMELVCRACASRGQRKCDEHGTEFLAWKCRYCCAREAQYFCFGTTHFCTGCHEQWQSGAEGRAALQAGKPCLGKGCCIFGGAHPPNSRNGRDEYPLGCTICAQDTECGMLVAEREGAASRRRYSKYCCLM